MSAPARADGDILYFTRVVPDYRVSVLERLDRRLGGRLVVCTGDPPRGSSIATLGGGRAPSYRQLRLRNLWLGGERLHVQPSARAFRHHPRPRVVLIEESPRSLSLPLVLARASRRGAGTVLWGHFSSNRRVFAPDRHWLDRWRLALARRATACLCYTDGIAEMLRPWVDAERLFVAPNTLDTGPLFELDDRLRAEGRDAVRRRLGLESGAPVLAFVGRLARDKRPDLALDAFESLRAAGPATLLVIGDGPERELLLARVRERNLEGVRLLGAIPDPLACGPWLFAADVLVLPGYLGLAVNHAFAFGLPVVSRRPAGDARYHSPEIDFLREGVNGCLAEPDSPAALSDAVRRVLDERERFSEAARREARTRLSVETMLDGIEAALGYAAERAIRSRS